MIVYKGPRSLTFITDIKFQLLLSGNASANGEKRMTTEKIKSWFMSAPIIISVLSSKPHSESRIQR